jgi:hypothetical protein
MRIALAGGAADRQPANFEHLDAPSDATDYSTEESLFAIFNNKRY